MKQVLIRLLLLLLLSPPPSQGQDDWRDVIPDAKQFLDCAMLSKLTYDIGSPNIWDSRWAEAQFRPVIFENVGDSTEFAVVLKGQNVMIAFRGSNDNTDWWDNLDINFDQYNPLNTTGVAGRVHRGFYRKIFDNDRLMRITNLLLNWFLPAFPNYDLRITGHSQGAATATIYGAYLAQRLSARNVTVLNFGSPRVGDQEWKMWLREELRNLAIFRVVYEEDIVTRIPLASMNFRHVGHLIYKFEHDNGIFKAYFQQTGDGGNLDGVEGYEWDIDVNPLDPFDSILDHSDDDYLNAIERAANDQSLWPSQFETIEAPKCCFKFFGRCFIWC